MSRLNSVLVVAGGLAAAAGAQWAADQRLPTDWADLVGAASRHGLALAGTTRLGFGGLEVGDVTASDPRAGLTISVPGVALRRSVFDLFGLGVTLPTSVTLHGPGGQRVDLWSRSFRFAARGQVWHFGGDAVSGARHGGGPDDAISFGTVGGTLAEDAGSVRLAIAATGVTLPARGAWPNGRRLDRISATIRLGPAPGQLHVERAAIAWGPQEGTLTFTGRLDAGDRLDGAGEMTLGPGWAETLKRANVVGALDTGEAEAAIGYLGLLEPDGRRKVSFPFTVQAGRVQVGPDTLFILPSMR